MKRLLVLVAVLVPLSLFIAGCGGTGGSSGKTPAGTPTADQKQKLMEQMMKTKGQITPPAPGGGTPGEAEKK
jgi:hypothetical protein